MYKNFERDIKLAQSGDSSAVERVFSEFAPLIKKYRYVNLRVDEDLLSELYLAALMCVLRFKVDSADLEQFLDDARKLMGNLDSR